MLGRIIVIGAVIVSAGCTAEQPMPTDFEVSVPLFVQGGNTANNLGTHLTGEEEVPPRETPATGQAIFRIRGTTVEFRLIASNINNINQAHIHCGDPGVVGPISIWLWPVIGVPTVTPILVNGSGPHNGVLASGSFSLAGVNCPTSTVAGVPSGMPVLDAIRAGRTYVNVHTNDGISPTNTGPGDFPGGEIRGAIDHASPHAP